MRKRMLSLLLAAVLCLSLLPLSATAADISKTVVASFNRTTLKVDFIDGPSTGSSVSYKVGATYHVWLYSPQNDLMSMLPPVSATAAGVKGALDVGYVLPAGQYPIVVLNSGGTLVANGTVTVTDGATEEYTVTYAANGGTGTMVDVTVSAGEKHALLPCGFTAPVGRQFAGWLVGADTAIQQPGHEITVSGNVTLTAQWEDAPATLYNIGFHGNGGMGVMSNAEVNAGTAYALPESTFTRSGYTFAGWKVNNAGNLLVSGETITVTANITLYAQWTAAPVNNVTVTFHANGGTGAMNPATVAAGTSYALPAGGFARSGYTFAGWKVNNAGATLAPGETITITTDTALYAQWTTNPVSRYIVKFEANGGTGAMNEVTVAVGASYTLPDSAFVHDGYIFDGWKINSTGTTMPAGTTVTVTANITLVAQWSQIPTANVTVSFEANGGVGAMSTVSVPQGADYKLPACGFVQSGHAFAGWKINGVGDTLNAGMSYTVIESITLVAQWTANVVDMVLISFNANNGSGAMEAQSVVKGSVYTLPECGFTRSGFNFGGWQLDGQGDTLAVDTAITVTTNIVLHAQWTAVGGSTGGGGTAVQPGATLILAPTTNGTVTANPASPAAGQTVTLTVTPQEGYQLDKLTIRNSDGENVPYTDRGNGTFTFVQQSGTVTVTAVFGVKTEAEPLPDMGTPAWEAFTDIGSHWAYPYICTVVERGLFTGTAATTFSPNTAMTRAMFATVLSRLDGVDTADYITSRFSDIDDGVWYTAGIEWAAQQEIVLGVGNNLFSPNTNITREQMAVILYRYITYKGYSLPAVTASATFADNGKISDWAREAVTYMQQAGMLEGRTDGTFDPQGTATRAEVAAVFARFLAALEN